MIDQHLRVRNNKLFFKSHLEREGFFSGGFLSWDQWFCFPGAEGPSHSSVCYRNGVFLLVTLPRWGFFCGETFPFTYKEGFLQCTGYLNGIAHHPFLILFFQFPFFPCQSCGFVLTIAKALQVLISFFRSGPTV